MKKKAFIIGLAAVVVASLTSALACFPVVQPEPSPTPPPPIPTPPPPPPAVTAWARTYGDIGNEVAFSIQPTPDEEYVVAGFTDSFGEGGRDFWVVKLDGEGNIQWQRTYGGTGDDEAFSIQPTLDRGYVVAGRTESFGAGEFDFWVVKLDGEGNIQWQKAYGGIGVDEASSIQPTPDGGYVVAGHTFSFGEGFLDLWVVKLDGEGNIQWQRTYGGNDWDWARSIQPTPDGGYVVAGATESFGAGGSDLWVLKLDGEGNIQWQRTYGGGDDDYAFSIQPTPGGGYVVAGHTTSFGAGGSDLWVVKLDGEGNIQWQRAYGGTGGELAISIQPTPDRGYIVAGGTTSFGAGGWDFWVLKLDGEGNIQWQRVYGDTGGEEARSIQLTDGGYVVAGYTKSFGAGVSDFWVMKLKADGTIDPACPPGIGAPSAGAVVTTEAVSGATDVSPAASEASTTDTGVVPQDTSAIVQTQCGGGQTSGDHASPLQGLI